MTTADVPADGEVQVGAIRLPAGRRIRSEDGQGDPAFCNEFGGTGLHDVPGITASLMNSPVWTFWWD
jgi:hypothetical protein